MPASGRSADELVEADVSTCGGLGAAELGTTTGPSRVASVRRGVTNSAHTRRTTPPTTTNAPARCHRTVRTPNPRSRGSRCCGLRTLMSRRKTELFAGSQPVPCLSRAEYPHAPSDGRPHVLDFLHQQLLAPRPRCGVARVGWRWSWGAGNVRPSGARRRGNRLRVLAQGHSRWRPALVDIPRRARSRDELVVGAERRGMHL